MIIETLEYLGIAFVSSALLIVMSKIILQHLIRRPADYYLAEEYMQEELMLNRAGFSITDEIETNPEGEITDEHIHVTPKFPAEDAAADIAAKKPADVHETPAMTFGLPESSPVSPEMPAADDMHPVDESTDEGGEIPEWFEDPGNVEFKSFDFDEETGSAEKSAKKTEKKNTEKKKPEKKKTEKKKTGKSRNPSMKMRKDELLAMAAERGVKVFEKATKKDIIELLHKDREKKKK